MKNINITKKTIFIITILVLLLVISLSSFAWYQIGNLRDTSLTVQANDGYVYNVEDIDAAEVLYASMGLNNNQATGDHTIGTGTYNTANGYVNYTTLEVNYTVQNTAVPKKFSFQIKEMRAYKPLATVTLGNTATSDGIVSGDFVYGGTTYYFNGTTVFNDAEYKQVNKAYAIDGTQLYEQVEQYLQDQLEEELFFQFYQGSTAIYTAKECAGSDQKITAPDNDPNSWFSIADTRKIYVNTANNGTVNVAVTINVVDDLVNRQYIGLKLKFDVGMSTEG